MMLIEFTVNNWEAINEVAQTSLLVYLLSFKKFKQTVHLGGGVKLKKVSSYALKSKKMAKDKGVMR